jgi:hypothetical protein
MNVKASLAAAAPWKKWRSASNKQTATANEHPDEHRPILHLDVTSPLVLSEATQTQIYGSTRIGEGSSIVSPSITRRNSLLRVPEEAPADDGQDPLDDEDEEDNENWELEQQGLYRGDV